jgi:hypothetical protein
MSNTKTEWTYGYKPYLRTIPRVHWLKVEHNESIDNYLPQFLHIGKRVGTLIKKKLLALQFGFEKTRIPDKALS